MKLRLKFNGKIDSKERANLENFLDTFLKRDHLGYINKENSITVFEQGLDFPKPEYSEIEFIISDNEDSLEMLLEILDKVGIPCESNLYNDDINIEVGTLSKIEVSFNLNTDMDEDTKKKVLRLEDRISSKYLDELCVVSANYIDNEKIYYYFYVIDLGMALPIVQEHILKSKFINQYEINSIDSNYGIAHRYFVRIRENYKENNRKAWEKNAVIYQGASVENITKLLQVYPNIPKSLVDLLTIIDGTWDSRHEKGVVNLPFLITCELDSPLNLMSSKQILMNKEWAKIQLKSKSLLGAGIDSCINKELEKSNLMPIGMSLAKYGDSSLFLDFNPSEEGDFGQVVAYDSETNEFVVIEKSFDCFLLEALNNDFWDGFSEEMKDENEENDYYDFEDLTQNLFWQFNTHYYDDIKEFNQDFKKYMKSMDEKITTAELKEIILEETEIFVNYEVWLDDLSKLQENEIIELEDDEELLEEDKEDGMWQVSIVAHLKSDSKKGFTLQELMYKIQNQLSSKDLGDHCFFEGFEYLEHKSLIEDEEIPVFNLICGS